MSDSADFFTLTGAEAHIAQIRRTNPEIWRQYYPRTYRQPPGYYRPDTLPLAAMEAFFQMNKDRNRSVDAKGRQVPSAEEGAMVGGMFLSLEREGVPTYFAAEPFLQAMIRTNPPDNVLITDIQWPRSAFMVILPRAFSLEYFGFHCTLLTTAYIEQDARYRTVHNSRTVDIPRFEVQGAKNFPVMLTGCKAYDPFDQSIGLLSDMTPIGPDTKVSDYIGRTKETALFNVPASSIVTEKFVLQAIRLMNSLVINLLLFMQEVPDVFEEQRVIIPGLTRGKGKTKEVVRPTLWEPKWIGREYRQPTARTTPGGGHHASPETHWRDGHWHTFLCGKGRTERKLVWIKPILVNKPE